MKHIGLRTRLVLLTLTILILAQLFNAGLTISSLENLYIQGALSRHLVAGNDMVRKIERAVRFGKPLKNFVGMKNFLTTVKGHVSNLTDILIILPDGTLAHSLQDKAASTWQTYLERQKGLKKMPLNGQTGTACYKSSTAFYVILPIHIKGTDDAHAVMVLSKASIEQAVTDATLENVASLLLTTGGAALILILGLFFLVPGNEGHPKFKSRLYTLLLLAFGCAQLLYGISNVSFFKTQSTSFLRHNSETVVNLVKQDIEHLLTKGVSLDQMHGVDTFFSDIIEATPEIDSISLASPKGMPLFAADTHGPIIIPKKRAVQSLASFYSIRMDRRPTGSEKTMGQLELFLSKKILAQRIRTITLDTLTVGIIAILFLMEMIMLLSLYLKGLTPGTTRTGTAIFPKYALMRPVSFLFIFAMSLSFTFIPLRMGELYNPLLGLSKDLVMGLPISLEMGCAGLAIVLTGFWIDRRGWHQPMLTGLGSMAMGFTWAGLATDAWAYLLALGVCGVGYGLTFMAAQGFVLGHTDTMSKASGLATFFAGVYAGNICGSAAGAMMADRMGYSQVFLVSGGLFVLTGLLIFLCFRSMFATAAPIHAPRPASPVPVTGNLGSFISNRNVLSLILGSIVPSALVLIGFINYALPIYLHRSGATQGDIGRIIMLYGICLVYVAPVISRIVDKSAAKKNFVFLAGLLGALGMSSYFFLDGLVGATVAVLFFGLSSSFGFASQSAYALSLPVTRAFGENKAMGLYNAAERIGQVLGPLTLGTLIAGLGMNTGIVSAGVAYMGITILFFLLAQNVTKSNPV